MKFKQFLEEETEAIYTPPADVSNAAKKALKYKEDYPDDVDDSGTRVGWTRANQLANRDKISLDIIKRMHSFFSRHKGNEKIDSKYKDTPWKDNGYLMHLAWGGDAGKKWAKEILDKVEKNDG
ncbi:MAG: hypothetical protein ACOC22_04290 [bacterium]